MKEAGTKLDTGKLPIGLIPREAIEGIAAALAFGAIKYAPHNYKGGLRYSRLLDSCLRHVIAYLDNESKDAESGLSHIDHALACLSMLKYMEVNKPELDDRFDKVKGKLNNE